MRTNKILILFLTLGLTLAATLAAAGPAPLAHYSGAGTVVTSFDLLQRQLTVVDNGAVVCRDADGDGRHESGQGGACIRFGDLDGDSILVEDAQHGLEVAFQVCLDMDGDGACTGGGGEGASGSVLPRSPLAEETRCSDAIIFSHSSFDGSFANPLNVGWMRSYWDWCGASPDAFPGYVVILCAGIHKDVGSALPHTHEVTTGAIHGTHGGGHGGDFCGGPVASKAYVLE